MVVNPGRSKVGLVRKIAAIVLASAFVLSVAACSDLPAVQTNCTPAFKAGSASESLSSTGKFGAAPTAKIPTPTISSKIENSTLIKGKGLELGKGDIAEITSSLYNGSTGQLVGATYGSGVGKATQVQLPVGDKSTLLPTDVSKALLCETVGSRIATVLTAAQVYGSASAATGQGIAAKQTMILVTDINRGYRNRATGILQPLQSGFPSVVTSGDGTPGLTLDLQEPPKTLQWELVRGGDGAKIKAGEKVLLQVQAVAWTNPAPSGPSGTFDSTWTTHTPRFYTLKALAADANGNALDPGSVKALVGQKVGSQVLVVVPPKYGYPSGKAPANYPTGETLIFVYDILGVY
jgi:FKBP-type peptidyl-prolyl cis-trans isomerase